MEAAWENSNSSLSERQNGEMTCHQQQQLCGCLLDTEPWVSSHSRPLIYAQSRNAEKELLNIPAGLDIWHHYSIHWARNGCRTSFPCAISSTVNHILDFFSSAGVLTDGERKRFPGMSLKYLLTIDRCGDMKLGFSFESKVCPPVFPWLRSDTLMDSRVFSTVKCDPCAIWRGTKTLTEKGNMVS